MPSYSGEIGDVAEIINGITEGAGFDMVVASSRQVNKTEIITGYDIKPGDPIIGLASSGLHSNGITLARKILFKQWGGKYQPNEVPEGLDREVGLEALEPTKIYVKPFLKLAREVKIKAAVHITGDAYLKFNNLTRILPRHRLPIRQFQTATHLWFDPENRRRVGLHHLQMRRCSRLSTWAGALA